MSAFVFDQRSEIAAAIRAELSAGIESKHDLLTQVATALAFPSYFGGNWDAFEECICDLSWLPPGDVVIVHQDLPLGHDSDGRSTYLAILRDAVENWKSRGSNLIFAASHQAEEASIQAAPVHRHLFIVFPAELRSSIEPFCSQSEP